MMLSLLLFYVAWGSWNGVDVVHVVVDDGDAGL